MSDQVKTTDLVLKDYEEKKTYISNIVDTLIVALAKAATVRLIVYCIDEEAVWKNVIQPIDDFQANVELSFVNGHYYFISSSTAV